MNVSDFPIGSTVEIRSWAWHWAVDSTISRGVVVNWQGDKVVIRPNGWDGVAPFWPSELSLDLITTLGQLTQTRVEPGHETGDRIRSPGRGPTSSTPANSGWIRSPGSGGSYDAL